MINKYITSCKQLHNIYIIKCLLCNSWESHHENTTPHNLISKLQTQGYSTKQDEHPHPRYSSDVMVYSVWAFHTAIECNFSNKTSITRMPTTIEQKIKVAISVLQSGIFKKDFTYTNCNYKNCNVCPRIENGLIHCPPAANYGTRSVL